MKYKIIISYDGSNYFGWQIQPNKNSIQAEIEKALSIILQEKIAIVGSGRTDAKVHAKGQVAHFLSSKILDLYRVQYSLNGILPKDIRILKIEKVSSNFHARFSATAKKYTYYINTSAYEDPFNRKYSYHFPYKIDYELLLQAKEKFIGTHDFTSFTNENKKKKNISFIRQIYKLDIKRENNLLIFEFEGSGFLYKMIRNIVGTLLDIATHKLKVEELSSIFAAKDRTKASRAMPPEGLFLMEVCYKKEISSKDSK